jgi:hypothetical protein
MSQTAKQQVVRVELRLDTESLEIINRKKQELNLTTTSETIRTILKQSA